MIQRTNAIFRTARAASLALGLALLPWRAVPAASLTASEPAPAPRSSRFT